MELTEKKSIKNLPIGIFDSGVGGLTVYHALHNKLPNERFVYLGDTARVPYGTKSLETVERYATENANFLASFGIKLLVVACNTASAMALSKISKEIGIEVIGVIGPSARKAVEISTEAKKAKIGVIATEATVSSNAYYNSIREFSETAEILQSVCPLFVSLAEEGWTHEKETFSIAKKHLSEIVEFAPDALVLGCTHYPILRFVIQETIGNNVKLIDSGEATAAEVEKLLNKKGLANDKEIAYSCSRQLCGDLDHFYVTDAADRFARVAERFLGNKPVKLESIEVSGIDKLEQGLVDKISK